MSLEVTELAQLKQAAALQQALAATGDKLPSGMAEAIPWIDKIIQRFKELFGLLTSSTATNALNNLSPLVSASPAPLAVGLSQIRRQMNQLSTTTLPNFYGNVSQLANQSYYSNSTMRTYNINVPVTATVNGNADIGRLAYAVAKEIAANVRQ